VRVITYYDTGFVLAVGSITVTGSLSTDADVSLFVKNAVTECVNR
jgi:hypothetical protein